MISKETTELQWIPFQEGLRFFPTRINKVWECLEIKDLISLQESYKICVEYWELNGIDPVETSI